MTDTPGWDETERALGIDADGDGTIGGVPVEPGTVGVGDGSTYPDPGDYRGNDDPAVAVATESEFAGLEPEIHGDHERPVDQAPARDVLGQAALDQTGGPA